MLFRSHGGGGGVFRESSSLLGQVFFLLYEGIRRRPEARRCPRPILGGPTRPGTGAAWGHPFWPSDTPSCPSFCAMCFFSIKSDVVFFPDFISCKNSQWRDFAKNSVRISSFIQIWEDLGANYEAKCLEKSMHFGCISSPKLSLLFVLKQFKHSAEEIKRL